ncbi:glutathione S-transferase N-terminal domain-containing protein [Pendulispora albinea]|uniref:glutathione transferase n=2 Tax=Pendulispora albinea TaxID=2741071 RepID=A0ABZ2LR22_9BACT
MKIFGLPGSPCTRKVMTTLAEKGQEAEIVLVDVSKGEQKAPAHLARQPFGRIPTLEDNGFSLYESQAIMRYLDEKLPGTSLQPKALEERARMNQFMSIEQSYLVAPAVGIVKQLLLGKMAGREPDMAIVEAAKVEVAKALDVADQALAGEKYLAGSSFSLADIDWMPYVHYIVQSGVGALITDRPNVAAWWQRVSGRPSWQKVVG